MITPTIRSAVFRAVALGFLLTMVSAEQVSAKTRRMPDASSIHQIGIASRIYAADHNDLLPPATDIWEYARILADDVGLDEPNMWLSKSDPANDSIDAFPTSILTPGSPKPRPLNPAFRQLKPSLAVALGKLHTHLPATTPIAWTRGLQLDGTWSTHSPYGNTGGYIVFLSGNYAFYKNLNAPDNQLVRFDGKGKTSNIIETLPPGTRVGEYIPTDEEKNAWAKSVFWRQKMIALKLRAPLIFILTLCLPFIAISVYRLIKKRPGIFTVLLWPILIVIFVSVLMPEFWRIDSMH